jgi:hypothetical protein
VIIVNTTRDGEVTTVTRPSTTIRSSAVETPTEPHLMSRGTKIAHGLRQARLKELFGRPDADGPSVAAAGQAAAELARGARPTFAKIGQILSTRPDLMPPEFIEELATLQDNVPPLTEEQVVRVMEQELGVPWEDVFETIDPRPLARGRSRRCTARRSPTTRRPSSRCSARREGADRAGPRAPGGVRGEGGRTPGLKQVVDMEAVFEHLSESLHRELDFRREAENIERMGSVIGDFSRLRCRWCSRSTRPPGSW